MLNTVICQTVVAIVSIAIFIVENRGESNGIMFVLGRQRVKVRDPPSLDSLPVESTAPILIPPSFHTISAIHHRRHRKSWQVRRHNVHVREAES